MPKKTVQPENGTSSFGARTEVVIVDDCGNAVTDASVAASFSNQDRSFDLRSLGDGRWVADWVPRQTADRGVVTVNIFAADSTLRVAPSRAIPLNGSVRDSLNAPVLSSDQPILAPNGAAQYAVSPGSRIRIRGSKLADPNSVTQVWLGDFALQVESATATEVIAVVPPDVPVNTSLQLIIQRGDALSARETIPIAASWPIVISSRDLESRTVEIEATGLGDVTRPGWRALVENRETIVESIQPDPDRAGVYKLRISVDRSQKVGNVTLQRRERKQ